MPAPVVDPLPPAPVRSNPQPNFVDIADAWAAALAPFTTQINAIATWINAASATISDALTSALAAIDARAAAAGFKGTSTTTRAVGTGSKVFVTQTNLAFAPGSFVTIADSAAPDANYMFGQVTAYNAANGDLTASVTLANGSGTKSAWSIATASPQGPAGTQLTKGAAADIWTGTDDAKFVTAKALADASAPIALNVSGAVTLDFNAGLNFVLTLTGNITLGVPSNMTNGDSGVIYFVQDGTGGRTLALNAAIKKPGGAPTLSTAAGSIDRVGYFVRGGVLELTALEKGIA